MIILGGLLAAHHATNGEYVNNYTVAGTSSATGKDALSSTFPQQGGYAGQIVFHAKSGTVTAQQTAVNQSVTNVSKLPHVIKAVSPFSSGAVSKDGTIAYSSVSWSVNSLDTAYLDQLNHAVAPARDAGLQIAYGAGAGQIGQASHDLTSEIIGLSCALVLLLFMFGSLIAAAIPLVSAIFSVLAGLSLLGVLASAMTFPTTAPTIATLLGLGVAVDYGLFLVARHREQLDTGMDVVTSVAHSAGTSGAAIVIAGGTVDEAPVDEVAPEAAAVSEAKVTPETEVTAGAGAGAAAEAEAAPEARAAVKTEATPGADTEPLRAAVPEAAAEAEPGVSSPPASPGR